MRTILGTFATLFFASAALAQTPATPAIPQQGPPPKNLTKSADGHFTANQDPSNPEKFELHVVVVGETLSGIAGQVLSNPRLWPQLWEQNEHIINPHWIYPNDKILIKPVTQITEARPPEPVPPPPPPAPEPAPPRPPRPALAAPAAQPVPEAPPARQGVFSLDQRRVAPEIKTNDLYCSGFVRKAVIPKDLKVILTFDADGSVMAASDSQYVYLSQGSVDGVAVGNLYQVVRPTVMVTNPKGRTKEEQDLGMHYLDIAQLRVVMTQPDFSLARIVNSCGDAVEVGDFMFPFRQIVLPPPSRPRPFSATMKTTGGAPGTVVMTKSGVSNFGSIFKGSGIIPGVRGELESLDRGIASEGTVVYIDVGDGQGVKPGDVFIVYREVNLHSHIYDLPAAARKLRDWRTAIGEIVVVNVGERASTALVTYSSDGISLGDFVERR